MPTVSASRSQPDIDDGLDKALNPLVILDKFEAMGLNREDIAVLTAMNIRSVRRWKTETPSSSATRRLGELRSVVLELRTGMDDEATVMWLRMPNRLLEHGSPLEALRVGAFRSVIDAARCFLDHTRAFGTHLTDDQEKALEAFTSGPPATKALNAA